MARTKKVKRTWVQWVVYLQDCELRITEGTIDEIVGLMELERQPSLWQTRKKTFAELINFPFHLGLSISPQRYEIAKAAVRTFGEERDAGSPPSMAAE